MVYKQGRKHQLSEIGGGTFKERKWEKERERDRERKESNK